MASPSRVLKQELGDRSCDSHHLQLPNGNFRPLSEHASPWSKLSQQNRPKNAVQPTRPKISQKILAKPVNSLLSPRQKMPISPSNTALAEFRPAFAIVTSPVHCKSPRTNISFTIAVDQAGSPSEKQRQRPVSSPISRDREQRLSCDSLLTCKKDVEPQYLLPINAHAREHIEIKACLLAHTHHLDVEELHQIRGNNQLALNKCKMQRIISQGGAFGNNTAHEEAKRKTTFLLRHFFQLNDAISSKPHEQLLCEVVEDWACGDQASSDEISRLWKSIDNHIEQSYLLRRRLIPTSHPNELSVVIAMDCLKKLPQRLPEYRRVLDVIIVLIESGLYLNSASASLPTFTDPSHNDVTSPFMRKRFYFEEYQALQTLSYEEQELRRSTVQNGACCTSQDISNGGSSRQRIENLFNQLNDDQDKKDLLVSFLRGNLSVLSSVACEEMLNYYLRPNGSSDVLFPLLMQHISPIETTRLLTEISQTHADELHKFAFDNMDSLFSMVSSTPSTGNDSSTPALFQRLVDRHPEEFAAILWRSPYLTAHIFQGSEHLVARVLEQNVYRISQVLTQRSDVLMPLLSHTFRESTVVLEEFFVNHPRGLADLLMNRSSAIAVAVKAKPYILSDMLQACYPTLTKVLASTPEIVSSVIKANPQALPQIIRDDPSILSAVFAMVPQCLGDTLEKNPELFVDLAHRKPALVSRLFAEHPDLLLEPLETNPALFTTFLVYHRSILPDFSDPDFDPTVFKIRTKKTVESGVQTSNNLKQTPRKFRLRDKLRQQSEELLEPLRIAADKEVVPQTSIPHGTELTNSEASLVMEENLTIAQIVNEIARVYVAKIAADEQDDLMNRKRQSLADFVLEHYTIELGLKPMAKRKLVNLLIAAQQVVNEPEAMRIKWFRRFLNAIPGDRPLPRTALDFYLLVLQHLIPSGQLMLRLEAGLFGACTVSQSSLKTLVDDALVGRLFDSKEQRQRLLAFQSPQRQDAPSSSLSPRLPSHPAISFVSAIRLDELLDTVMKIWMQYQLRVREEWTTIFQEIVPNASGVAHFDAFSMVVRSKFPVLDNRTLMKIYNSCGQENEQGDFTLYSDDFTLAMSILQEQHILRQYAASSASTASSAQLSSLSLSLLSTPPVFGRH